MSNIDKALLKQIVDATAAGTLFYVSQVQGQPMLANVPPLIEINPAIVDPTDGTKVACRSTAEAAAFLAAPETGSADTGEHKYAVMTGIALPEAKKRGNTAGSGAPTKYPFADMPVGGVFFSGNSEHKNKNALKALGSTVSAQNDKYSEPTGEMKTVTRAVRDPATKKAKIGTDGKKVTETVQLPVKKYNRKFTIRAVEAGYKSGDWVAPEAGALIGRTV